MMLCRQLSKRARSYVWMVAFLAAHLATVREASALCPLILFDPAMQGTVYVGLSDFGLQKTTDNGTTWSRMRFTGSAIGALAIDPRSSRTLYAGTFSGMLKSIDAGETWNRSGLDNHNIDALVIDPHAPSVLYARASRDAANGWPGAVYKSIDGGAAWTLANDGLPEKQVYELRASPSTAGVLYAGTGSGVFKTTDGGQSWRPINAGIEGRTVMNLVIDAAGPDMLFISGARGFSSDSRVFTSTNGGETWTEAGAGLPADRVLELVRDPTRPGILYAGTNGRGLYRTVDAGATWQRVELANGYPCRVAVSPHDSQLILAATTGDVRDGYSTLFYRTVDGGARWEVLDNGLPRIHSIAE